MDEYIAANLALWEARVPIHAAETSDYNVAGFKRGTTKLKPVELAEAGDVRGKSLLHLQCHFGLDTLSWAREGAAVTGVDFSPSAIEEARRLSQEVGVAGTFILSDIYGLPDVLPEQAGAFDVVFASYGSIWWLPDVAGWAREAAHFLKPGGFLYIVDAHPMLLTLEEVEGRIGPHYRYFHEETPLEFIETGTYADKDAPIRMKEYGWAHTLMDITGAAIGAGLRLDFLHEFPYIHFQWSPFMAQSADGLWRVPGMENKVPVMFSMKATKPE